ncbi:hypothetical protein [Methylobacterium indicum]|uniref:hypothetical protein n=1 Tax=Methylobacterium indicum TaxID=1775910 RepID=UPI000F78A057|nr:hypothetical protein [Methylobacterium indicum]
MMDAAKTEWPHKVALDVFTISCSHYKQIDKNSPDYDTPKIALAGAATVRFVKTDDEFCRTVNVMLEPAFAPNGIGSNWNVVVKPSDDNGHPMSERPDLTLYIPKDTFFGLIRQFELDLIKEIYAEVTIMFERITDMFEPSNTWLKKTEKVVDATLYGSVGTFYANTESKDLKGYYNNPYARPELNTPSFE